VRTWYAPALHCWDFTARCHYPSHYCRNIAPDQGPKRARRSPGNVETPVPAQAHLALMPYRAGLCDGEVPADHDSPQSALSPDVGGSPSGETFLDLRGANSFLVNYLLLFFLVKEKHQGPEIVPSRKAPSSHLVHPTHARSGALGSLPWSMGTLLDPSHFLELLQLAYRVRSHLHLPALSRSLARIWAGVVFKKRLRKCTAS
jgi:hypothetical protein